jgi:transposase
VTTLKAMLLPSCSSPISKENTAQAETAQIAAADKVTVPSFERRQPARRLLPEHLRRARRLPAACPCCGDSRLRKLGEDVTEMLGSFPANGR